MSMHTRAVFVRFGAESMIPTGLGLAMIQEIGPLVTALLVAGRVSSGIGAQLGSMRVNEQIDALEASAVDSFKYLVVTRLIACVIALPLLTTLMNFSGLLGGYLVEVIVNQISPKLYLRQAMAAIGMAEFVGATFKTVVFGFIIGSVSTHLGYYATGGSTGVGLASTRSVVRSSLLLILINVILVKGLSFFFPEIG